MVGRVKNVQLLVTEWPTTPLALTGQDAYTGVVVLADNISGVHQVNVTWLQICQLR